MKKNPLEHDYISSGDSYQMPPNSTTEALVLLSATIDFIGCWLQALEHNLLDICQMYINDMKKLFLKYQLNFLKHLFQRRNTNNYDMLLEVVGI